VGRIGNLLLLPIQLNQEAQNFPFDTKKKTYAKHNLRMVQDVCKESDWTLSQIEAEKHKLLLGQRLVGAMSDPSEVRQSRSAMQSVSSIWCPPNVNGVAIQSTRA